ncbi:MAG: glycosyltransferase, partial [Actinomycetota bacterium]
GALVYQLVEYEDRMPELLTAADVALCRAGASTVAELAIAGLPSILVPLPIAPRDAQRANAGELVGSGAAVLIADADLDLDHLLAALEPIVDDADRRDQMAAAARSVARPDAAHRVAQLLIEAADDRSPAIDRPAESEPT